jgi:hypothetical protein
MHRLEFYSVAGEPHFSPRDYLMTRGATELLKPGSRLLLRTGKVRVFQLGDEIHRGQQRNATFIVLADLHPLVGEAELTNLSQRMTVFAAMLLEDVVCPSLPVIQKPKAMQPREPLRVVPAPFWLGRRRSAGSVASPISPRWRYSWRQTNRLGSPVRSFVPQGGLVVAT